MKTYSPFHLIPEESRAVAQGFEKQAAQMNISDENLREYVNTFLKVYRSTLEQFFSALTPVIPFYVSYPFETFLLRMGNNGVITGHRPSKNASIKVVRPADFDPPLETVNIFTIVEQWQTPFVNFDFRVRKYDAKEAEIEAKKLALNDALNTFWQFVDSLAFSRLCIELLGAEGIEIEPEVKVNDELRFDARGRITLSEPAGFRRIEQWGFEFKHYKGNRVSARDLRQLEAYLDANKDQIDAICLVTSGDLTSVGTYIAVENPKIRVWDSSILQFLVNQHLDILESYFADYKTAVDKIAQQFKGGQQAQEPSVVSSKLGEFEARLKACPPGQKCFAEYERIGIEIWKYLFSEQLGEPKPQCRTIDGKQRRDVLFRNQRTSRFFERINTKFSADFVIIDFKNHSDPIGSEVIDDVEKYANKALGRFIVVVSRLGAEGTAETAQLRLYRDRDVIVLAISDGHMLEMIARKERNENPEDVLEDLLDEILVRY